MNGNGTSILERIVGTIRAVGDPEWERSKAYQDYQTLSDEEIEARLEKVEGISWEALRVQAGRKTTEYYMQLQSLHRHK